MQMTNRLNSGYSFIVVFILILLYIVWNLMTVQSPSLLLWGGFSFHLIASILSFWWLYATYLHTVSLLKYCWLLLALSSLLYFLGIVAWGLFDNSSYTIFSYNPAQFLWIAHTLCYLVALIIIVYYKRNLFRMYRVLFDSLIVMVIATTISWTFVIQPLMDYNTSLAFPIELVFPIIDLGILFGVLSLSFSTVVFRTKTTVVLTLGMLMKIIADTIYSYEKLSGIYQYGSMAEPLWVLSILLIGLAGVCFRQKIEERKPLTDSSLKKQMYKQSIPYVGVIGLFAYVVYYTGGIDSIVFGLFVSIILIIVRQVITVVENEKLFSKLNLLNEQLELKVKQRTEQLEKTLKSVEFMAYYDMLTKLPNRRLFEDNVAKAIKAVDGKLAVMILDLDRFKVINDTLGHSVGDLLLKDVSDRLKNVLTETAIYRIGGDEFAIVLENVEIDDVKNTALTILEQISKPFFIYDRELHITPSIGISISPDNGSDCETLLMHADTAMYKVKEKGKNHFQFYHDDMKNKTRLDLELSLRKAIMKNEFVLHYQPQTSIKTGEIIGAEALIRWKHPKKGMISPFTFIPLAEETGMISVISDWVLKTVCKQIKTWQENGIAPTKIAINISSNQFQQPDFVESIAKVIEETGVSPKYLELEITESLAMDNTENIMMKLAQLKQMGIQISIDDFGTGYSSLRYLSQFQIDKLKIDRSFIHSAEFSDKDAAIVKLITVMAKGLNLKVIAEGVEKPQQIEFLKDIGCEEFQGYYLSPPLPIDEFDSFISNRNSES
ncbi:putative bifunctional diguanylate cyclase/phosphodiesterase [Alkalihalobacterium bogoriense]|uniref:putative bifunctional diguanylate cyclase/phosphodiesterase n=1 Tax=Alkalihalobacterium bogoriense TaxID=246272 RepID=UPI00047BD9B3|nr:GGDEF domain-containing phosphodiesterase [Alkalihalobacterium bogoriense]